ncbi:choice-of-anchor D domain-containing protein [Luteimonas sp. MC1572]|uniref:choice-of-anchor D domain-containing protein n=1 Tax=Luteimonas sp. MC1572 TaxID=2799325 RepID=UPI0018F070A7|nr:choice-of-anchor D domain-containing protein [Luteimonas sp. MC1572]MBJ6981865.1 choice-of-anchor D domain-containing protein [Luteimonas sp. MC1572]QQO03144.1 choice-of-anchor D domain-containing protein [Luteimonas sp. MC1572]
MKLPVFAGSVVVSLALGLALSATARASTVFAVDFAGGIAGWATSGSVDAYQGTLRLRGAASATRAISTAGYSAVRAEFTISAGSLESNEFCHAEVSTNGGGSWTAVLTLGNGQDNGIPYTAGASPAGIDNSTQVLLRLRGSGTTTGDYCYGHAVVVSGTAGAPTGPDIVVPASLGFGSVAVGASANVVATVANAGTAALVVSQVVAPVAPFSITAHDCGTLAPGASCQVQLRFAPLAAGSFSGTLVIASNDPDHAQVGIALSATATTAPGGGGDFDPLPGNGNVARSQLGFTTLMSGTAPGAPLDYAHYALPAGAATPGNTFAGRLTLSGEATAGGFTEHVDSFRYTGSQDSPLKHLPEFDFELVQTGSHIVPVRRDSVPALHPHWEYVLSPGRVWDEAGDNGYSRVALPFALQQKNANCMHNGVLTFLFRDDGAVSKVAYQIASETCLYFKVDMWGLLASDYTPAAVAGAASVVADHQADVAGRMPVRPLSALAQDYPGTDPAKFAAPNGKDPQHVSLVGFVIDGIHYSGGCTTRRGAYPYCESLVVPSYSAAKSVFAGLAMMRLEASHPGTFDQIIGSHVPACAANGSWNDVTFGNALDMATGNYALAGYMSDEGATHTNGLFLAETHAAKIGYSCSHYSRKAQPGSRWVYHSSDTYILGTAMNARLKALEGAAADIYADTVLGDVLLPLGVGRTADFTRRTYDATIQPFTGWGLMWTRNDVARITDFLASGSQSQAVLDQGQLDAALQRDPADRGLAPLAGYRYNNGFWAHDVGGRMAGCSGELWIPLMSGYGGITVLILPNRSAYYYFSDDDTYLWMDAALAAHGIRSLCP